jgi:hypothetical protein
MRGRAYLTDAAKLAPLIGCPALYEQSIGAVEKGAKDGIFVGNTHFLPFFFDPGLLMNPHVFVCGITGSGKTYLMRNLMLKLYAISESLVVIVDFTGEYRGFVELVGEGSVAPETVNAVLDARAKGIIHVDLSRASGEAVKVRMADAVLSGIAEGMRRPDKLGKRRVFVMLDEAWKLLGESRSLETILREGRKYSHGLIFSSQLMEDVDLAMLSNAGTVFAFRLQNAQSLDNLARNYNLRARETERIQNLNVGSCAVIQTNASNRRGMFFIRKVAGVEVERFFRIVTSGSMELEVRKGSFETEIKRICSQESAARILRSVEESGYAELDALIVDLIDAGADRRSVLASLRSMGMGDKDIAEAFAIAVSRTADEDGKKQ